MAKSGKETNNDDKLKCPLTGEPNSLIMQLCNEGEKLLEKEDPKSKKTVTPTTESPPDTKKELKAALAAAPTNPYARARIKVLQGYSPSHRKMIEKMEFDKDTENRIYDLFVKEIAALGDKFHG